jgi:two-component system, OmpR family, sensor kinase
MMFRSMRARLTLWYTGVLALVLILFSLVTYASLVRAAQRRTDNSLGEAANSFISTVSTEANDEGLSAAEAAKEAADAFYSSDRAVIVYDDQQQVIAMSGLPQSLSHINNWSSISQDREFAALLAAANSAPSYATANVSDDDLRAVVSLFEIKGRQYKVLMVQPLREQAAGLALARRVFYLVNPLALLLASLGGYFLAQKSLAPVIAMADQCERIGAANLDERLTELDPRNELGRLVGSFNSLLSRLQTSFQIQRRFMADASHELRTPVAIIRGESEVALSSELRTAGEYRESLAIVQDEGKRLARIVDDLFTLARADAGQYPVETSNMYLDETVGHCVRSVDSLATQRGLRLDYETSARELFFSGDEALLQRMTLNILDNAIKYTPSGGRVRVSLERNGSSCQLAITDTGRGIPADDRVKIFERFFRADQVRSRAQERNGSGAGLGLSIARWIAELHGGKIALDNSDETGSTFVISLPLPQVPG